MLRRKFPPPGINAAEVEGAATMGARSHGSKLTEDTSPLLSKRNRLDQSQDYGFEDDGNEGLKRQRKNRPFGELRLMNDLEALKDIQYVTFEFTDSESRNDLLITFMSNRGAGSGDFTSPGRFLVRVPKNYPHSSPHVKCLDPGFTCSLIAVDGTILHPKIGDDWNATHGLGDVLTCLQGVRLFCESGCAWHEQRGKSRTSEDGMAISNSSPLGCGGMSGMYYNAVECWGEPGPAVWGDGSPRGEHLANIGEAEQDPKHCSYAHFAPSDPPRLSAAPYGRAPAQTTPAANAEYAAIGPEGAYEDRLNADVHMDMA